MNFSLSKKITFFIILIVGLWMVAQGCSREEEAVFNILKTMPRLTNLYIHVQQQEDASFGICFFEKELAYHNFWDRSVWLYLKTYENFYHLKSQHVFIGSSDWIVDQMDEVNQLFNLGQLNIHHTYFLYVIRPPVSVNKTWDKFDVPTTLQELNPFMKDDVNAVAMFISYNTNDRMPIGCRLDDRSGSKLVYCGDYKPKMALFHPLWPPPITNFFGRMFRFTTLKKPTVFTYDSPEDGLEGADGWAAEISRWMFGKLNVTAVFVPSDSFGTLGPKGWTGMVGVLYKGEADVSPLDFSPIANRLPYIDFTDTMSLDYGVILSKAPSAVIKPFLLLQIFTVRMWGILLVVALGTGILTGLFSAAEEKYTTWNSVNISSHVSSYVALVCRLYIFQSSTWLPKKAASRFLCTFAFTNALLVASIYRGSITAFFAIPFRSKPIDNYENLFATDVIPAVRTNAAIHSMTLNIKEGNVNELSKRMVLFMEDELSQWTFFGKLNKGEYALVDLMTSALGRARRFESKGDTCRFYISKSAIRIDHDVFAFSKNSPLKPPVNKMTRYLRSFGIIEELKRRAYNIPCERETKSNEIASLSLIQMQSAFYVLVVGFVVCCICIVLEILSTKI